MSAEAKPLATVPELVLKKRKRDELWAKQRQEQLQTAKAKSKDNRKVIFKRAEAYVKEYRQQVRKRVGLIAVCYHHC